VITITYTTDPQARAAFVADLRALADFLADHGDVPVPQYETDVTVYPGGTDDDKRAEVDRIAASLGTRPADQVGLYRAVKSFGPVTYQAVLLPEAKLAATEALMSYSSAFRARRRDLWSS
jgi:hypothetical protein